MKAHILKLPDTLRAIDRSSWVSWLCFYLGYLVVCALPSAQARLEQPVNIAILLAAIAAFFVAAIRIQSYMNFSLLAKTYGEPNTLFTGGVFRWSRNPIYVAFLIPLAALGLFSWAAAAVAIVSYLVVMTRFVISKEEADLDRAFGAAYTAYKASTPRWLF